MKRIAFFAFLLMLAQSACAADSIPVTIATVKGEVALKLEVVSTPQARATGLMNRDSLKPYDGMLFLFPRLEDSPFWMKDTRIPLDILFVGGDGKIMHIAHDTTPLSTDRIRSNGIYASVIEIAGGRTTREDIREGDRVRYTLPEGMHAE